MGGLQLHLRSLVIAGWGSYTANLVAIDGQSFDVKSFIACNLKQFLQLSLIVLHIAFSLHDVKYDRLKFVCRNSKQQLMVKEKKEGGMGLVNVRRRLDLLFHDTYTLNIEDRESEYEVSLDLPLTSPITQANGRQLSTDMQNNNQQNRI